MSPTSGSKPRTDAPRLRQRGHAPERAGPTRGPPLDPAGAVSAPDMMLAPRSRALGGHQVEVDLTGAPRRSRLVLVDASHLKVLLCMILAGSTDEGTETAWNTSPTIKARQAVPSAGS
jgi:hypothetical protein